MDRLVDIDSLMTEARDAVRSVGLSLRSHYGNISAISKDGVSEGSSTSVTTYLDIEAETALKNSLPTLDGRIGFYGEELGGADNNQTFWLVDPIDGTSHFIRGMPFCTTMVALVDRGAVIGSIIYNIASDDLYWAVKDNGAFCNDRPITVSNRPLGDALLSYDSKTVSKDSQSRFIYLQNLTKGLFSTINSGYEFTMVASGKIDGRICYDPYGEDWDYAPGMLLVSEAGGVVLNLPLDSVPQRSFNYKCHNFVATNKKVYKDLRIELENIFNE